MSDIKIGGHICYDWINENLYWDNYGHNINTTIKYVNLKDKREVSLEETFAYSRNYVSCCVDPRLTRRYVLFKQTRYIETIFVSMYRVCWNDTSFHTCIKGRVLRLRLGEHQ